MLAVAVAVAVAFLLAHDGLPTPALPGSGSWGRTHVVPLSLGNRSSPAWYVVAADLMPCSDLAGRQGAGSISRWNLRSASTTGCDRELVNAPSVRERTGRRTLLEQIEVSSRGSHRRKLRLAGPHRGRRGSLRFDSRGSGFSSNRNTWGTEIFRRVDVSVPSPTPLLDSRSARTWHGAIARASMRGDMVDVELGDPAFDDEVPSSRAAPGRCRPDLSLDE